MINLEALESLKDTSIPDEVNPLSQLLSRHAASDTQVESFLTKSNTQIVGFSNHILKNLHHIIKFQGEELFWYRVLESFIVTQTLNEEKLKKVLEELKSLRVAAMQEAQSAAGVPVAANADSSGATVQ